MIIDNGSRIEVSKSILDSTLDFLQELGKIKLESHALWVGKESDGVFKVSAVWFPEQTNTPVSYEVPEEEEFRINLRLNQENLLAICQIHTHPDTAFHSSIDDEGSALVLPDSLSIVIPNYGFIPKDDLSQWEVYVFNGSHWCHLRKEEVKKLFQII